MARNRQKLSRRTFLKGAGALVVATGTAAMAAGCETNSDLAAQPAGGATAAPLPVPVQYPEVPYTPMAPPPAGTLRVFTPHEARTVEALTARILPGTPDDPGAREAGVVYYIDNFLA
jgi:gluconate 2-dehydrogenase gamma chain